MRHAIPQARDRSTAPGVRARRAAYVPRYLGLSWTEGRLPQRAEPWLRGADALRISPGFYTEEAAHEEVEAYARTRAWVWPDRVHYLLTDIHADADAFARSLVACGGVERTGPGPRDFHLSDEGAAARFVIAGDCFDKGPNNLELLRSLKYLIDLGADVVILAGNHDVRALVGMSCMGASDPRLAHLFVRMGKKTVPLFKEISDGYLADLRIRATPARERRLRARLFPDADWFDAFRGAVTGTIPDKKIDAELVRIAEKSRDLEVYCERAGLSLALVERAADKFRELFLEEGGEFAWFFERMQVAYRAGSFLFVHAGVDDTVATLVRRNGVPALNACFQQLLADGELFELYHGPVGNVFRTKYRDTDRPLSEVGAHDLRMAGIHVVVHGHRSIVHGQRLVFRRGLLNVECDASVDRNTRALVGLAGPGGAATIFRRDACVLGVSTDFPAVKVFDLATAAEALFIVSPGQPRETPRHTGEERRRAMGEMDETEPVSSHLTAVENDDVESEQDGEQDGKKHKKEAKRKAKLSFEQEMDTEEAVTYFEAIIAGLKKGAVQFRRGEQQLDLAPAERVRVKVKAAAKGNKEKVEFELSWSTAVSGDESLEID